MTTRKIVKSRSHRPATKPKPKAKPATKQEDVVVVKKPVAKRTVVKKPTVAKKPKDDSEVEVILARKQTKEPANKADVPPETYSTREAIAELEKPSALLDLGSIARDFVNKRLNNTRSVEDLRRIALNRLQKQLEDSETQLGPAFLLEIIDTLNNSSKDDIAAIMKANMESGKGGTQGNNYFNLFLGGPNGVSESAALVASKETYALIEKLVTAADSVVGGNGGSGNSN